MQRLRKMKSLVVLVIYCISFSLMLVFFYPIFSERQQLDSVNKASFVLDTVERRQAQYRSK